jgi:hypothetical protein
MFFFPIEISGRRIIFNAIVLHSSPVAVVPQPVLSHAGLSQAPEKVSPPPTRLRALLTSVTDSHRLGALVGVRIGNVPTLLHRFFSRKARLILCQVQFCEETGASLPQELCVMGNSAFCS